MKKTRVRIISSSLIQAQERGGRLRSMAWNLGTGILVPLAVAVASVVVVVVVCDGFPTTMTLERAFPVSRDVELSRLVARDKARHGRMLQSSNASGVIDFPVGGTFNPLIVGYDVDVIR